MNILEHTSLSSLKDKVKQEIRNAIISNELKPGERIIETEIAKKNFGTSQVPVREALRGLEEEGLVKSIKYKGAFAADINHSEIFHMYSLRAEIEANVVGIILPTLTKRHIGELYDIAERMKTNSEPQDYAALSAVDVEFHWKIIEWGQISVYNRIWHMLNGHIRRFIAYMHPSTTEDGRLAYGTHERLIIALEKRECGRGKGGIQGPYHVVFQQKNAVE